MVRTASSAKALARFTFFSSMKQKLQALRGGRPNYREPGQDDRRVDSSLADDLGVIRRSAGSRSLVFCIAAAPGLEF